jgi:eukaryotic-like serine/threonine-protein kinase
VLAPGVLLSDRYQLDARLATGGMGDVWRGTDLLLGRQVAVKVLLPTLVADPEFIARFRAEARIMAALHHPGIVQVYDCGEQPLANGTRADYLVMEYVAGEPLSQRIKAVGRLGVEQTLSVVAQAAHALHAAHCNGIVHRDVKPGNLLIQPDGTVVLVDFGVARSSDMARITSANAVPGTALYMAPEQAAGRPVSASSDIYALGAVTYHCLAGEPPYSGRTPLDIAVRHLHDEPPTPPAGLPVPVAALISRALAKAPADRHPSAEAFAEAAEAAMATAGTASTGGGTRTAAANAATMPITGAATAAAVAGVAAGAGAAIGAGVANRAGVAPGPRAAAGTFDDGTGPKTLPGLPIVPAGGSPAEPVTRRPERPSGRAVALAAGAALLVGGALLAVLGFGPGDGAVSREDPPASTAPSGGVPGAGASVGAGADADGNAPAPSGRTSDAPAAGAASTPTGTGSPTRSAGATPSTTPSAAPTTARPTATTPTATEPPSPTPASSNAPPSSPQAPAAASPANP